MEEPNVETSQMRTRACTKADHCLCKSNDEKCCYLVIPVLSENLHPLRLCTDIVCNPFFVIADKYIIQV